MGAIHEPAATSIGAELLERMARIARGLPGHIVSVETGALRSPASFEGVNSNGGPVLLIDGVDAARLFERYFDW